MKNLRKRASNRELVSTILGHIGFRFNSQQTQLVIPFPLHSNGGNAIDIIDTATEITNVEATIPGQIMQEMNSVVTQCFERNVQCGYNHEILLFVQSLLESTNRILNKQAQEDKTAGVTKSSILSFRIKIDCSNYSRFVSNNNTCHSKNLMIQDRMRITIDNPSGNYDKCTIHNGYSINCTFG